MVTARRTLVVALLVLMPLAGCGGGGGKPNGEAAKSADQILADTQAALSHIKSLHFEGTINDEDGKTDVTGDIALPGRFQMTFRNGNKVIDMLFVAHSTYLKANKAFWDDAGIPGALAGRLANRWVKQNSSAIPGVAEFEAATDPATVGHCLLGPHFGTITKVGTDSVDGHKVVVLADAGDKPGSQPGRLYVATDGSPLPLRATETGATKPGGAPDATCHETKIDTNTSSGELRFSDYDKNVDIKEPTDAIDLSQFGGQQQQS
jgi:hypothetical protein